MSRGSFLMENEVVVIMRALSSFHHKRQFLSTSNELLFVIHSKNQGEICLSYFTTNKTLVYTIYSYELTSIQF